MILYVEFKRTELTELINCPRPGQEVGEQGKGDQKVGTSSYKIDKSFSWQKCIS